MKTSKTMAVAAAALALAAVAATAEPYVVMPNGQRVQGTAIRMTATGDINLTTPQGIRTFAKGTFAKAVADEPAEYKQATAALAAGKYDVAEKLCKDIAAKFRGLTWDVEATKVLGKAQIGKGDAEGAVQTYEKLFAMSAEAKKDGALQWDYRKALLAAKQYSRLAGQLDQVAANGSRADAARAQTMRGDIQLAQNNVEGAVLDYLRTAILFADVKDADVLGEACFKAAQTLEQLRDPRAKEMYAKVVNEYGTSKYAAQARGKM